jgi:hypothetical protein
MSFEAFNSVGGYTVGIPPTPVINENGIATLTGLQVAGISNLGSINNVILLGGADGYYLQTNGSGGLTWAPANGGGGGNGVPGGSNSEVQFNNDGDFGGDAGFTYDNVNNQLSISGNTVATNFVASGNVSATNFVATGNISGGNLNVTKITATGNISAGNAQLGNYAAANFYAGNGYLLSGVAALTANYANFAGNVTASNQPNIRSLGTLANLTVGGRTTLGSVSNVKITGGQSGYVLQTDGTGNLSWSAAGGGGGNGVPGGVDTTIQFNNAGVFGGILTATYDGTNLALGDATALKIYGGTPDQVLKTDGTGNLTWANELAATPAGSNTQIQYNNAGNFAASTNFTFNNSTNTVTLSGDIIANAITIGSGEYKFSRTSVYFATSVTTTETLLMTFPTSNTAGLDFTVISTDSIAGNRQICKLEAVYYDGTVHYNEYNTIQVNGPVGDFAITYEPGNISTPAMASLYVFPTTSNMTTYKIQVTAYQE